MTTGTTTGATGSCCDGSKAASLERVRFFPRQLLTPDDLTTGQEYFLAKLRRHNRFLHGWGVVCGAGVRPVAKADWTVVVEPGYLLGPQGDEIVIDECVSVDLSRQGLDGNAASPCVDQLDPWCSTVRVDRRPGDRLFVAVAYAECPTRPVRVQPLGCGCEGASCEYSRLRDGYVIRVLDRLPDSYAAMKPPINPRVCFPGGARPCPDAVADPWVILAVVTLKVPQISNNDIDNISYRRHVVAFGDDYLVCGPKLANLVVVPPLVIAGDDAKGTVTIDSKAPPGGSYVELRCSDPSLAIVPDHVTVLQGSVTADFVVNTPLRSDGGAVIITGTLVGSSMTAPLSILTLRRVVAPALVPVGSTTPGSVVLSAIAPSDQVVTLQSSAKSIAVPASVKVLAGQSSASFDISAPIPGHATITGKLGSVTRTADVDSLGIADLQIAPNPVFGGVFNSTGTVTLSQNAPAGGTPVVLSSANTAAATVVTPFTIAEGAKSGDFTITTRGGKASTDIKAQFGNAVLKTLNLDGLSSLVVEPNSVTGGGSGTGTVKLTAAAPTAGLDVNLSSTPAGFLDMPKTLHFAAGDTLKTFKVNFSNASFSAKVIAELGGSTLSFAVSGSKLA